MTEIKNKIFVQNIFYMLAYFFYLPERIYKHFNDTELIDHPYELLAEIFLIKLNSIKSKGFNKNYLTLNDSNQFIKGKIDLVRTEINKKFGKFDFFSEFEELSYNTIQNQFIKFALKILLNKKELINKKQFQETINIYKLLIEVDDVEFKESQFTDIKEKTKIDYYLAPLFFAHLIISAFIPTEDGSSKGIKIDFSKKIFPKIFEGFVTNFYIKHKEDIDAIKVDKQKKIPWDFNEKSLNNPLLPGMFADILIEKANEHLIIDTKLYLEYLKTNQYGQQKLISGNLYQMHSYIMNYAKQTQKNISGKIIYANIYNEALLNEKFLLSNNKLRLDLISIDLFQKFENIKKDLIEVIN